MRHRFHTIGEDQSGEAQTHGGQKQEERFIALLVPCHDINITEVGEIEWT
jgi:hypothetical protein